MKHKFKKALKMKQKHFIEMAVIDLQYIIFNIQKLIYNKFDLAHAIMHL